MFDNKDLIRFILLCCESKSNKCCSWQWQCQWQCSGSAILLIKICVTVKNLFPLYCLAQNYIGHLLLIIILSFFMIALLRHTEELYLVEQRIKDNNASCFCLLQVRSGPDWAQPRVKRDRPELPWAGWSAVRGLAVTFCSQLFRVSMSWWADKKELLRETRTDFWSERRWERWRGDLVIIRAEPDHQGVGTSNQWLRYGGGRLVGTTGDIALQLRKSQ